MPCSSLVSPGLAALNTYRVHPLVRGDGYFYALDSTTFTYAFPGDISLHTHTHTHTHTHHSIREPALAPPLVRPARMSAFSCLRPPSAHLGRSGGWGWHIGSLGVH